MRKFFIVIVIVVGVVGLLASPLLSIQRIDVVNNSILSERQVLNLLPNDLSDNVLAFSTRQATASILENPYVQRVRIIKNFWERTITIELVERTVVAYVQFSSNQFLHIDREGRVLEVSSAIPQPLPIVTQLDFADFMLGEVLQVENKESFNILAVLAGIFLAYNIEQEIMRVDISDIHNLRLHYGNIVVNLGTMDDIEEKIRIMQSILPEINHFRDMGGILNIPDIRGQWVFELLT